MHNCVGKLVGTQVRRHKRRYARLSVCRQVGRQVDFIQVDRQVSFQNKIIQQGVRQYNREWYSIIQFVVLFNTICGVNIYIYLGQGVGVGENTFIKVCKRRVCKFCMLRQKVARDSLPLLKIWGRVITLKGGRKVPQGIFTKYSHVNNELFYVTVKGFKRFNTKNFAMMISSLKMFVTTYDYMLKINILFQFFQYPRTIQALQNIEFYVKVPRGKLLQTSMIWYDSSLLSQYRNW
eukprot:TRINITY_DN4776_c0_g2_i1.p2 TRINITY_DN4776_c0_g2~~TRINITY_DN4776_c0_g2_i1.p2  ORF type:complete len:235 (-),score=-7.27 TRINITY_DN4776_c0_g2_i1:175-879(-)